MPKALAIIILAAGLGAQALPDPDAAPGAVAIPPELKEVWEQYEQLIQKHPDRPLLHYNFGNLAYGAGQYQRALKEYQGALRADDRQVQSKILYNLGNSLFRAGNIADSKGFFRKALEIDPTDEDARVNYEIALRQEQQEPPEQSDSPAKNPDAEPESEGGADDGASQDQASDQNDESQTEDQEDGSTEQEPGAGDQSEQERDEQAEGSQSPGEPQDDLKREEAEAILNALRANEQNLLNRVYRPQSPLTLEKDW